MKGHKTISFLLVLILTISVNFVFAQEAMEKFGKNRVQYKNFKWRYYSTENFDIYFYDGGNEIARIATKYLEKEFDRVTDILGTVSYSKTEIYLYNSPTDLLQSNIGVNDNSFDVAGQTDFVKPMVEIAYPGNAEEFKKILIYKVSSMLIYDMMFGGSLSDMFQNSYLLFLPEWFMSGAARYTAYGWDVEMDDFIRDMMRNKKLNNLAKFTGNDAELIGQSIWNFIAERYGTSYISNILNLTRIIRNEERSISGTIGIPYKSFIAEWSNYYLEQTSFIDQNYILPDKGAKVNSNKKGVNIKDVKISPEGNYYAYTINNKGKYKVILSRIGKNKEKVVLKGGYKVINQEPDKNIPLLSWKDENTLGIINTRYGKNYLWIYEIGSKKKVKKELTRINQIKDFDIVRNGNLAVLSADRNGDHDLYLISLRRNSIKRITSDFYDDVNPRFIPGTSSIIFSSNRTTDTIDVKGREIENISNTYNIFIYNIDSTKKTVHRITNTLSTNIKPMAVNANEYYFISEQQGIYNLYKYDLSKKIYHQVSNFGTGIKDYDISYDKRYFSFVMSEKGKDNLYLKQNYNLSQNIFTAQTKRQQYLNAKFVAQRLKKAREKRALEEVNIAISTDKEEEAGQTDSDQQIEITSTPSFLDQYREESFDGTGESVVDTKNYLFTQPFPETSKTDEKSEDGKELLDTDSYVFDTDVVKSGKSTGSFLSSYRRLRKESDVAGPFPFETKFSADNIVTSFVIDPLVGFGLKLETQMNDQLENHKFYGGLLATTDLKSGSFYGEYRFLKYTIDFHTRYARKSLIRPTESSSQKYTLNTYEIGASLPFSVTSRLSVVPFFETTRFWDLDPTSVLYSSTGPVTSKVNYAGVKFEFIYDNTTVSGLNLIQGTRGKVGLRHNEGISDSQKSFSNLYLDLRHYQKIHRELVLATRLFYGRYWGANPQKYLLGGMDNWLFNKTNSTGEGDPLRHSVGVDNSNILFVDYVTSLRGFDYNTFNGDNTLLFNAELRLPFIKYLVRGPIASNFLRNLQFIGFYDIGSAWTGPSPFATENSVNTEIIAPQGSPFKARIQNFKNPWLSSYGFGVRTVLLGYYVKFDVAYPIEDFVRKDTKFLVTLGYDF
ncbi:MAG: translocation protein TolB [Cyclobacteriaceae bacterium]|nr:translocation protein TolB [Cyclobacteriaceae bacterium]